MIAVCVKAGLLQVLSALEAAVWCRHQSWKGLVAALGHRLMSSVIHPRCEQR